MKENFDDFYIDEKIFANYAEVVTVPELAKMLRIGRNSAYNLVNERKVRSVKVGSQIRISKSSIVEFLERG